VALSVIGRVAPELERFLNRHILGIAPHPDHWPPPPDCARFAVPSGYDVSDVTGAAWVLAHEQMRSWHHRRTTLGAEGFRFARNGEFDCGWRLADVAARFIRTRISAKFDLVSMAPQAPGFRSAQVLPWIAERLAHTLEVRCAPNLFASACPFAEHPDVARYLAVPVTSLFTISAETDTTLNGASVLLVDWRRHTGRTLRALAQLLRRCGATVIRFTWFD
jgi:hypothetical protein